MNQRPLGQALAQVKLFVSTTAALIGGVDRYICYATSRAHRRGLITGSERHQITGMIHNRLGDAETVEQWLTAQGIIQASALSGSLAEFQQWQVEIQKYRHRWLDALIAEFS